jgi:outer membrane lipoprotein-sorting protein
MTLNDLISRILAGTQMIRRLLKTVSLALLMLSISVSVSAISLDEAAKRAAKQNDAKVLSARTVQKGSSRVHEIKLLTKKGVVKTVRVPDNSKQ